MRCAMNCLHLGLCVAIVLGTMAIDAPAQAPSGSAAASIATTEKRANALYNQKQYREAFAAYQKGADLGSAVSENMLGWMYENGQGATQDYSQAMFWIQKAAAKGNPTGQNNLGWIYQNGFGVSRDYSQAMSWYQKAASKGSSYSQSNIGSMYEYGWGVVQDYSTAMLWFQKSAAQGNSFALGNIGYMFLHGLGTAQNYSQALAWSKKGAAQGDAGSQDDLGYMYLNGLGVAKNLSEARAWFQKAADQGLQDAINSLAQMNAPPAPTTQAVTSTQPALTTAAAQPAPQQTAPQQGTCAAVYIVFGQDSTYGTHVFYGAAWSRTSYADALAGAKTELMKVVTADEVDPRQLPDAGGQYAATPEQGSGCTYAHGTVAGALKIRPSGGSMWNPGGAAGTSVLGPGIYDMIDASFGDSTDASASAALSKCRTRPHVSGGGDSDSETCTVLQQW